MSETQQSAAGNLAGPERTRLKDELAEMRGQILESRASRAALITGILVFLLFGKLGLTLAMALGLVAGAIVYFAKKVSLQKKLLSTIPGYDDERLRYWREQAALELVAAQKRSTMVRGTLVFVGVVLLIVWIIARVQ